MATVQPIVEETETKPTDPPQDEGRDPEKCRRFHAVMAETGGGVQCPFCQEQL